jgi:polyhydroxyalkanoate synthesis regulator protein
MQSVVPQFLAASFEMLRDSQTKMMENLTTIPNPLAAVPGFDALRKQQEAFLKTVLGGMPGWSGSGPAREEPAAPAASKEDDLAAIKKQLADLQNKLSKL